MQIHNPYNEEDSIDETCTIYDPGFEHNHGEVFTDPDHPSTPLLESDMTLTGDPDKDPDDDGLDNDDDLWDALYQTAFPD